MDLKMDDIKKTFEELDIKNTDYILTNLYPLQTDIPETFQIRLDNVSKELSEDH